MNMKLMITVMAALLTGAVQAATTNTFKQIAAGTYDWTVAENWDANGVPVSANDTTVTIFQNTATALSNGTITINADPATLTLNTLTINGKGAAAADTTVSIGTTGNTWTFDGTSPTINLYGIDGTKLLIPSFKPNIVLNQNLTFAGNGTANSGAAGFTFSGNISGSGYSITKSGTSRLTLSGTNTYSGGTFINGGAVVLTALDAKNLGGTGANITFNGTGSLNGARDGNYSFGSLAVNGTATLYVNSGAINSMTFTGPVTGSGTLKFASASNGYHSEYYLNSTSNTFTGPIIFLGNANNGNDSVTINSLGDGVGAGSIQVGANTRPTQYLIYGSGAIEPLTLNYRQIAMGGSTGNAAFNNNATNANAAITINTDLLIAVAGNKTFTLGGTHTGNNTFAGAITNGSGSVISLTKADAGKWILAGTNTYTGVTTVSGGILQIAKPHSLYAGNAASWITNKLSIASGAVLALNVGGTGEFGAIDLATFLDNSHMGASTTNAGFKTGSYLGLDTSNAGGSFTPSAAIPLFGTGNKVGLNKLGAGTLILNTAQAYTGNTRISAGALHTTSLSNLDSSYIQLNGGVLESNGSFTRTNSTTASGINFQWQSADGGGFSANGGKLTVKINNLATNEQVWGTAAANNGIWGTLKFGSATANSEVEFQNNINLSGATRMVDVAAGAGGDFATLSGVIRTSTGTAGLTKTGAGTLQLTGTNTYNGATTINDGTLEIGGAGVLGGGLYAANIVNTGTFRYNSTAAQTISGVISGTSGSLIKANSGTLILTANNTYNGATTISEGTLVGVAGGDCPNSAVTVSNTTGCTLGVAVTDNTKQWTCGSLSSAGTSATLAFGFGAPPSPSLAPLNVTGDLTFIGTPSIILNAAHLTTGTTYPLIVVGGAAPTGVPTVTITGTSGTLAGTASWGGVDNKTLSVTISGTSYQPLTWNAGNSGTWDINATAAWTNSNAGSSLTYQESALIGDQVQFTDNSLSGTATVTLNTIVKPASVTVNNSAQNITISGTGGISGVTGLNKSGSKTLTLSTTANSYSGDITIGGGTLVFSTLNAWGGSGKNVTFTGTSTLTPGSYTAGQISVNNGVTATITAANVTFATAAGSGNIYPTLGNNTITLTDASAFHGNIRAFAGGDGQIIRFATLSDASGDGNLQFGGGSGDSNQGLTIQLFNDAGPLTLNNRRIEFLPKPSNWSFRNAFLENNNATPANTLVINTALLNTTDRDHEFTLGGSNTGNNEYAGVIGDSTRGTYYNGTGILKLYKTGVGKWVLSGVNTFTGRLLINQGTLSVGTINNYGVAGPIGQQASGPIQLGGRESSSYAKLGSNNSGAFEYTGAGQTVTRTFQIGSDEAASTGAGGIYNNGTGALTFNAINFNPTISGITATRTLTLGGTYTASANEIKGIIQNNATGGKVALTKSADNSVWILSGSNTYSGATTVNAGTLRAGIASVANYGAFGTNSAVTVANDASAVLDLNGYNTAVGSLAGVGPNGSVTLGSATLTVGSNNTSPTFAGVLSGNGGNLVKVGTGTNTLSGVNLYTGTTTVSAGTLRTTVSNCLSTASSVVIASGAKMYLNFTGTNTVATLKLGGNAMAAGVYNATTEPTGFLTGEGALKVTTGPTKGTVISFK